MFSFPASESLLPAHEVWSRKDHSLLHLWKLPQPTAAAPPCLPACRTACHLSGQSSCLYCTPVCQCCFATTRPKCPCAHQSGCRLPFSRERFLQIIRTALWFCILFSEVTLTCAQASPNIHTVCSGCNETPSKCSWDITLTRMGRS